MPIGKVFKGHGYIHKVRKELIMVLKFLQNLDVDPNPKLVKYDDWWEHDGLLFVKGKTDFKKILRTMETSRGLFESCSDDFAVYNGIGPKDESWYLRYQADWDCDDDKIEVYFAVALNNELSIVFVGRCLGELEYFSPGQDSEEYFKEIFRPD